MSYTIHTGDCIEVMRSMDEHSVHAIVTDPPYGLEFMGRDWDHGVPGVPFWIEALRVLKPGGHLLAFGGTRTHHRLMCAIEDAGFEIRDCMMWLYGSGFPKSLDVSKAIDKVVGVEREVVGHYQIPNDSDAGNAGKVVRSVSQDGGCFGSTAGKEGTPITAPATDAAKEWDGWGTALKPSWEPIIVARKPLVGTVAENVQKHGTGGLNIDGSRIGSGGGHRDSGISKGDLASVNTFGDGLNNRQSESVDGLGRWPANLILDEESAAMLDEQSGESVTNPGTARSNHSAGMFGIETQSGRVLSGGDSGGASRFFYTAKASKSDRGEWNDHPTVKPTDLMRYLVNLVSREGQTILDPFAGSGTTLAAAVALGREAVGIELNPAYVELIEKRMRGVTPSLFAVKA